MKLKITYDKHKPSKFHFNYSNGKHFSCFELYTAIDYLQHNTKLCKSSYEPLLIDVMNGKSTEIEI